MGSASGSSNANRPDEAGRLPAETPFGESAKARRRNMDDAIKDTLDNDPELQALIATTEWSHDSCGALAGQAVRMCMALGADEAEAREYLEI